MPTALFAWFQISTLTNISLNKLCVSNLHKNKNLNKNAISSFHFINVILDAETIRIFQTDCGFSERLQYQTKRFFTDRIAVREMQGWSKQMYRFLEK